MNEGTPTLLGHVDSVKGGVVTVHTKPYEIKTVVVKFAASRQ